MPRHKVPLNKEILRARISYIEDSLGSLERFKGISFEQFHANPDNFRIAYYDLHSALEAVLDMDIGSHILSRIPGARPSSYKDIPRLLEKIVLSHPNLGPINLRKWPATETEWFIFMGKSQK